MLKHEFGGAWTEQKLACLRKYLTAYTTIFHSNKRARTLRPIYVDAFAGMGYRSEAPAPSGPTLFDEPAEPDADQFLKGSVRIVLEVEPPFREYVLIEKDPLRAQQLGVLKDEYPNRAAAIRVLVGDANEQLQNWVAHTNWGRSRAVVFLDPYGMQVDWPVVELMAGTQAIDLWILFPLGAAVNRLLTRRAPPPPAWAERLTRFFGTDAWQAAFYPQRSQDTLFGIETTESKAADWEIIGQFFLDRLKTVFYGIVDHPLVLYNSRSNPIYLFCFAAGNPKGAATAVRIAQEVINSLSEGAPYGRPRIVEDGADYATGASQPG
ncbi:MAG: three-Cys-motif partner protein TcmP [Chloroflexota bacterium]